MSIRVRIPSPLRALTEGKADVAADGTDVATCLTSLESQYPGISGRILDDGGEVKRFVNLFVNGEDIRFLEGVGTKLNAGDEVSIVPAMAGGAS